MTITNETIERIQKVIEHTESTKRDMDDRNWDTQEGCLISFNEAKAILASVKGEEWVSCNDALPEKNGTYDVWEGCCFEAGFYNGVWKSIERPVSQKTPYGISHFRATLNPTHWKTRYNTPPKTK